MARPRRRQAGRRRAPPRAAGGPVHRRRVRSPGAHRPRRRQSASSTLLEGRARELEADWPDGRADRPRVRAPRRGRPRAAPVRRLAASTTFAAASGWSSTSPTTTPTPEWPDGIELRPLDVERDGRLVHAAIEEAFAEEWGHRGATVRRVAQARLRPAAIRSVARPGRLGRRQDEIAGSLAQLPEAHGRLGLDRLDRRAARPGVAAASVSRSSATRSGASARWARRSSRSASTPRTRRAPCASTSVPGCVSSGGRTSGRRSYGPVADVILRAPTLDDVDAVVEVINRASRERRGRDEVDANAVEGWWTQPPPFDLARGCRRGGPGRRGRRLRRPRRPGERRQRPLARRPWRGDARDPRGARAPRPRAPRAPTAWCGRWPTSATPSWPRCSRSAATAGSARRTGWASTSRGRTFSPDWPAGRRRPDVGRGCRRAAPPPDQRGVVRRPLGAHADAVRGVAALAAQHGRGRPVAVVRRGGRGRPGRRRDLPAVRPRRPGLRLGLGARRPARAPPHRASARRS